MALEARNFYTALDTIDYTALDQKINYWERRGYKCVDLFDSENELDFRTCKKNYQRLLDEKRIDDLVVISFKSSISTVSAILIKSKSDIPEHQILGIKKIQLEMSQEILEIQ